MSLGLWLQGSGSGLLMSNEEGLGRHCGIPVIVSKERFVPWIRNGNINSRWRSQSTRKGAKSKVVNRVHHDDLVKIRGD